MKLKALLLALAVAGAATAFGLTDVGRSDTGTGTTTTTTTTGTTTTTTGSDCKRFWVAGSIGSIGTSSFTVTPTKDWHSSAAAGAPVTVGITADTHVLWQGKGTLAGPAAGDIARVFGKQCGQTATAWLVVIRPAKANTGSRDGSKDGPKDGAPSVSTGDSKPSEHHRH